MTRETMTERLDRIRKESEQELEENEEVKQELQEKNVVPQGFLIHTKWGERYFV